MPVRRGIGTSAVADAARSFSSALPVPDRGGALPDNGSRPTSPRVREAAEDLGLRAVRAAARLVGGLAVGGLTLSVAVAWAGAEAARAVRTRAVRHRGRTAAAATRTPPAAPGACVWCGHLHERHPVLVHADRLAVRFYETITG
ncbi:hypothetical protein ACL02T_13750 [Pseudonocardia sp. RS010]|uniref:hypothetical protein n=1 Tax=Pseudonocardia sp. RS010 TaxID=3385979 RepID=UPI0039A03EFA